MNTTLTRAFTAALCAGALTAPAMAGPPASPDVYPNAVRSRALELAPRALQQLAAGDLLTVELFDGFVVDIAIDREPALGQFVGSLDGFPGSHFALVRRADTVSAEFTAPGLGTYRLRGTLDDLVLIEIDELGQAPCGTGPAQALGAPGGPGGLDDPERQPVGAAAGFSECDPTGAVIDVLVVYTPPARDAAGGTNAILADIDLAFVNANLSYANSNIPLTINLVHVDETPYDENASYGTHLGRLGTPGDGYIDEVHLLRYVHQADMVAMFVADGQFCGIAWLMPTNGPAAVSSMFSVTTIWCSSLVFAHELGHNMGCCHAPGDGGGCLSGGLFSHSVGYRYNGNSGSLWRTVMAYSPGTRIPNFSNPDVNFDGQPTGEQIGTPEEADNAATINTTRITISNFYCGLPFCANDSFTPSGVTAGMGLGTSLDMDGDVAIAGAPYDGVPTPLAGSAFVFRYDGQTSTWSDEQRLQPAGLTGGDLFGHDVGVSGDRAIIGAIVHDAADTDTGAAWIYEFDGNTWNEAAALTAPVQEAGARFGSSVDIDGDVAVVGASQDDEGASDVGAVYIFRRSGGGTWEHEQTFTGPAGTASERFGQAVSLNGNLLIVGAPRSQPVGEPGQAHVYRYAAGSWQYDGVLDDPQGLTYTGFGVAVDIEGDLAVVGAPSNDSGGTNAGSVFLFRHVGNAWTFEDELRPGDVNGLDSYGTSVVVRGDTVAAGSTGDDDNGNATGSVQLYRFDGMQWVPRAELLSLDPQEVSFFGGSLALDGIRLLTGASNTTEGGTIYTYTGFPGRDCNTNGEADDCEILAGDVLDENGNGIPDECDVIVIGDLDGNGAVDTLDLLALLAAWGACSNCDDCPADFDDDCSVGTTDFLTLLANWG